MELKKIGSKQIGGEKNLGRKKIRPKKNWYEKKFWPKKMGRKKLGPKNLGRKIWAEIFSQIKFTNKNNQQNSSKDKKQKMEKSEHFLTRGYEKIKKSSIRAFARTRAKNCSSMRKIKSRKHYKFSALRPRICKLFSQFFSSHQNNYGNKIPYFGKTYCTRNLTCKALASPYIM